MKIIVKPNEWESKINSIEKGTVFKVEGRYYMKTYTITVDDGFATINAVKLSTGDYVFIDENKEIEIVRGAFVEDSNY